MSYTIHLSDEQFLILQELVNRGMEQTLAPFDSEELTPNDERFVSDTLAAVAFFNSHSVTHQ